MRAADLGMGLRLTAEEVGLLAADGAIEQCAFNDVARVDESLHPEIHGWEKIDPHKYAVNPSLSSMFLETS